MRIHERQVPARVPDGKGPVRDRGLDRQPPVLARRRAGSRSWTIRAVNDDGGSVAVVDRAGKKTTISPVYATSNGLAWSPDGSEVWYTAAEVGSNRVLRSATLSGRTRTLARVAGSLTLQDVTRDGRVLISHDTGQIGILARGAADAKEVDLSWLDWSLMSRHLRRRAIRSLQRSGRGRRKGLFGLRARDRRFAGGAAGRGQRAVHFGRRQARAGVRGRARSARARRVSDGRRRSEEGPERRTRRSVRPVAARRAALSRASPSRRDAPRGPTSSTSRAALRGR